MQTYEEMMAAMFGVGRAPAGAKGADSPGGMDDLSAALMGIAPDGIRQWMGAGNEMYVVMTSAASAESVTEPLRMSGIPCVMITGGGSAVLIARGCNGPMIDAMFDSIEEPEKARGSSFLYIDEFAARHPGRTAAVIGGLAGTEHDMIISMADAVSSGMTAGTVRMADGTRQLTVLPEDVISIARAYTAAQLSLGSDDSRRVSQSIRSDELAKGRYSEYRTGNITGPLYIYDAISKDRGVLLTADGYEEFLIQEGHAVPTAGAAHGRPDERRIEKIIAGYASCGSAMSAAELDEKLRRDDVPDIEMMEAAAELARRLVPESRGPVRDPAGALTRALDDAARALRDPDPKTSRLMRKAGISDPGAIAGRISGCRAGRTVLEDVRLERAPARSAERNR